MRFRLNNKKTNRHQTILLLVVISWKLHFWPKNVDIFVFFVETSITFTLHTCKNCSSYNNSSDLLISIVFPYLSHQKKKHLWSFIASERTNFGTLLLLKSSFVNMRTLICLKQQMKKNNLCHKMNKKYSFFF